MSIAKVYFDDNSSSFDFKGANISTTNYTTLNSSTKLRFEFGYYPTGSITTRYIDTSLFSNNQIRVCANLDNVVHYEQLLISATVKQAILKNVYSNCIVAGDYTRFAYQDALSLKAFTIPSSYYLYTFDDGVQIQLASLDGSLSSYVNLDTLDFKRTAYNFNVLTDALTFMPDPTNPDIIIISYLNLAHSNTALNLKIKRLDTNTQLLDQSTFASYDNFTIYFNYGVYAGVTNATLFQATLTKTASGTTSQLIKYFNNQAKNGILNGNLACVISLLLTIFGLSLTISRITFGWFGIFVELFAITLLAVAPQLWYIILLEAINVIILVYIVVVLVQQNYPTISS